MDAATAVAICNRLTARPGYSHRAFTYDHRQEDSIVIRIGQPDVRDSSTLVDGQYPETIVGGLVSDFAVYVGDAVDATDIADRLVDVYQQWDAHETREFLRDVDGVAALHPHTRAGQLAWAARHQSTPERDVAYGVRRIH